MSIFYTLVRAQAPALVVVVFTLLGVTACANLDLMEDPADYAEAEAGYRTALSADADDAAALQGLGILYMRTNRPVQALPVLERATMLDSADARVALYYGLALEANGRPESALRVYERYPAFSRLSPYRRLLAGRYQFLAGKVARDAIRRQVAASDSLLRAAPPPPNTIAVFPLEYQGRDPAYAPLGRGMAEMLANDLANVAALRQVERLRLQALIDELELARSGAVDAATAPRAGRLLGAGRVLGGTVTLLPGDQLRVDARVVDVATADAPVVDAQTGALAAFYQVEKALVFDLLQAMDITLEPEERERIEQVPTVNLQAFLAFSRGLEAEDGGDFQAARAHYLQASQIDQAFQAPRRRSALLDDVSAGEGTGTTNDVLSVLMAMDAPAGSGINIVDERLRALSGGVGSGFVPGDDKRKAPVESNTGLPGPRPPPTRTGNN